MSTPSSGENASNSRPSRRRSSTSQKMPSRGAGSLDCQHRYPHQRSKSIKCLASDFRSRSIPISKYIHRTPSEVQLCEDEAMADYRDYCMYSRIVGGISKQQMKLQSDIELRYQNDETLANIIRTRHEPPNNGEELEYTQQDRIMHILHEANNQDNIWGFYDISPHQGHPDQEVFVLDM